jgi:hypothetical protein
MAAKKAVHSDRLDPKKNKSLAIRNVVKKLPGAKAAEIADAVKKEYGHTVSPNMVYMVKTKGNMAKTRKRKKTPSSKGSPVGAAQWVEAIQIARQLLQATGSVDNATALLKAVNG